MESPYKEILIAVSSGGIVTALIGGVKLVSDLIEKRQKEKQEKKSLDLSAAAELRRLEHEHGNDVNAELWRIIVDKQNEIVKLKQEIQDLDTMDSLTRPVVLKLRKAARTVGSQIEILISLVVKETAHKDLLKEIEILEQNYNELENQLP